MGYINMELPEDVHKEAKKKSVEDECTLREVVIQSLCESTGLDAEEYLEE